MKNVKELIESDKSSEEIITSLEESSRLSNEDDKWLDSIVKNIKPHDDPEHHPNHVLFKDGSEAYVSRNSVQISGWGSTNTSASELKQFMSEVGLSGKELVKLIWSKFVRL